MKTFIAGSPFHIRYGFGCWFRPVLGPVRTKWLAPCLPAGCASPRSFGLAVEAKLRAAVENIWVRGFSNKITLVFSAVAQFPLARALLHHRPAADQEVSENP